MHIQCLLAMEQVQLVAAADVLPGCADKMQAAEGCKFYEDWEEMLEKERPDVVHICTPHYLHVPMAVKALGMGIHVLTEKPCAINLAQLTQLQQAQKASGKQLGVCFQNRYNSSSRYLKQAVESGKYGKLLATRAFVTWNRGPDYFNSAAWRGTWAEEGGGVMINQAIHTLDLLQYTCGNIQTIQAHCFNDILGGVIEVEDTATAQLELDSGIRALFFATISYAEDAPVMLEVKFENAVLRLEKDSLYLFQKEEGLTVINEEQSEQSVGKGYWGNGHKALIGDFYDCLASGRAFAIDAFEGGKAAQAVLRMYESSKNNAKAQMNYNLIGV